MYFNPPYDSTDKSEFVIRFKDQLADLGVSKEAVERIDFSLEEGSIIVRMRGSKRIMEQEEIKVFDFPAGRKPWPKKPPGGEPSEPDDEGGGETYPRRPPERGRMYEDVCAVEERRTGKSSIP